MRTFKTGGVRDDDNYKPDYEGYFSPLVIEAFGDYMTKHRQLKDGSVREGDNWQKHFGEDHYAVCMKSLWRHFLSMWKAHRGYETEEDILDSMMAIMFNVQAYADKHIKDKQ